VAILVVELLPLDNGMVAGICPDCVGGADLRDKLMTGFARDLGTDVTTYRVVHQEGRA
jgi:hypothetical protein